MAFPKLYGIIPAGKEVLIFARDGKRYAAGGDVDELKVVLTEGGLHADPNIIDGFVEERLKRYRTDK